MTSVQGRRQSINRRQVADAMQANDVRCTASLVTTSLSELLPSIGACLLALTREASSEARALEARLLSLLPARAQTVWRAYGGDGEVATFDTATYRKLLPLFVEHADDVQLARYASLILPSLAEMETGTAFDMALESDVCDALYDAERWAALSAHLSERLARNWRCDADFWRRCGTVQYALGAWDAARDAFAKAVACGGETADLAAYRVWLSSLSTREAEEVRA